MTRLYALVYAMSSVIFLVYYYLCDFFVWMRLYIILVPSLHGTVIPFISLLLLIVENSGCLTISAISLNHFVVYNGDALSIE